jgi:hypothetical protein
MENLGGIGKVLILIGIILVLLGTIIIFANKIPFIGKLPGDFSWRGKNWSFYFPLGTSILLSVLISLIIYLIQKFK